MYKTLVGAVVALCIGAVAGAALAIYRVQPKIDEAQKKATQLASENQTLSTRMSDAMDDAQRLADENDALRNDIARLKSAQNTPSGTPDPSAEGEMTTAAAPAAAQDDQTATAFQDLLQAMQAQADGDRGDRRRGTTEEERQQWVNQRRQAFAAARERMAAFMDDSISNAKNKSEQERLTSLRDNVNYLAQLSDQLHNAQTDEDKEAYRQAIQATRDNVRNLVRDQQDAMMRDVARQYGIKSPDKQDEFIQSMRHTQTNPLFRAPMLMMGGSWGGRRSHQSNAPAQ